MNKFVQTFRYDAYMNITMDTRGNNFDQRLPFDNWLFVLLCRKAIKLGI